MERTRLKTGAVQTSLCRQGTGEAVLFIHGSGPGAGGHSNWQLALPALGDRFLCLAPDLVGYDQSTHPDPAPRGPREWMRLWVDQLIGLLDALPIFGTGTVLIPWGIFLMLQQKWYQGVMLLGLYLVCYFMREFVEAKLMGKKMGLTPLETLMSMYVGLQLFGFLGFILGPVGLMLIEDLVEEYWKNGNNTCNKRNNCDKISG